MQGWNCRARGCTVKPMVVGPGVHVVGKWTAPVPVPQVMKLKARRNLRRLLTLVFHFPKSQSYLSL